MIKKPDACHGENYTVIVSFLNPSTEIYETSKIAYTKVACQ